jgi:hypothetical protein
MNMLRKFRRVKGRGQQPGPPDSYWKGGVAGSLDEPDDGHYIQIGHIDVWQSMPFQVAPRPDPGEARQAVRQLIEALGPAALDEGSGAVLDLRIDAWTQGWIHGANMAAIDNASAIDVHYGQAMKFAVSTEMDLEHAKRELDMAEQDHAKFRDVLAGTEETR